MGARCRAMRSAPLQTELGTLECCLFQRFVRGRSGGAAARMPRRAQTRTASRKWSEPACARPAPSTPLVSMGRAHPRSNICRWCAPSSVRRLSPATGSCCCRIRCKAPLCHDGQVSTGAMSYSMIQAVEHGHCRSYVNELFPQTPRPRCISLARARPSHICTRAGLTPPATFAPGLGSPHCIVSARHRPICTGTALWRASVAVTGWCPA